jgi:tetrapyrrole methylase family protein/MazG family protein
MKQTFEDIIRLIEHLRSPKGCPWDREQTIKTLKNDLLGEAKEVAEAIDKDDNENLKEELGDLMWSIIIIAQIAKEQNLFDITDILELTKEKIKRRHPHVFGDKKANNVEEALKIFNEVKEKEKNQKSI